MTTMNREEQKAAREKNGVLDNKLMLAIGLGRCSTTTLAVMFNERAKRVGRRLRYLSEKGFVNRVSPGVWERSESDPDSNLSEQLRLAQELIDSAESGFDDPEGAWRLAELVLALDEWIKKGGFLPQQWQVKK